MKFKKRDKEGLFKSLFAAYAVLLLHVLLLAVTGVTVVLFRGVYHYLPWIMGGLALLVLTLFWLFYLRMKKSARDMRDVLSFPQFRDRRVEVKLLGGLATFKIDAPAPPDPSTALAYMPRQENGPALLEMADDAVDRRLTELARLYTSELITREEFELTKKQILRHHSKH